MNSSNIPAVIAKIISKKKNLTYSENEIANFVINNPDFVINNTITNMANRAGVSETSINRFCKKVGYKGFNDFKIAFAQDNFYRNLKSKSKSKEENDLIDSIASDYNELILTTCSLINKEDINKVVEYIKKSRKVYIFGVSSSWFSALELNQKLHIIGIDAETYNDTYNMKLCSVNSSSDDVIIAITRSISVREIVESLSIAHKNNTRIVTITSYDSQKLNELADVKIITSDKITIKNNAVVSEHLPFLFIVDLLFGVLINSNKKYLQRKLNSEAIIENEQTYSQYYELY